MLRDAADFVIIDSPPLLPVADTRVLLRLSGVDGVILIGRARVTRRDRIRGATRLLAQSGRRVFGLVVTDVKITSSSSYYHYGYDEPEPPSNGRPRSSSPSALPSSGSRSGKRVKSPT
jgi:succinoglycan biosynthesis transport protein ExoP